jgi:hypothetical protein
MFYGAVVVPVGASVLQSDQLQGFITRSVTNYLNLAGVVALSLWSLDLAFTSVEKRKKFRWLLLLVMWIILGLLAWLHIQMDGCLNLDLQYVIEERKFYSMHRVYLILSTIQWALAVLLTGMTLVQSRRASP